MIITVGSLFSGIGGLDLGLERAGMEVKWQCEIDPFCRKVLAKHWPGVPCYEDVRDFPADAPRVDLICGGFPCQDISHAGLKRGIKAERSGLFFDFMRIVRVARPDYVLLENVPGLLTRPDWMGAVLGELAKSGFNAEWDCIPAAAVGAPHRRDRVWIMGARRGMRSPAGLLLSTDAREVPDNGDDRCVWGWLEEPPRLQSERWCEPDRFLELRELQDSTSWPGVYWYSEPCVGRLVDGIPRRVDRNRLKALGNAVVPQVAEWIGRRIMEAAS